MGRPPDCHCHCGEVEPPAVTDCEDLLCICLIDENSGGIPDAKMQGFIDAFPNRVLIVLDVAEGCCGTMSYSTKFLNYNRALSLREEYGSDPSNLIEFMERDNGRASVAITNDPWGRIKEIIDRNGLTTWLDTENTEVSIFVDNSGSMRTTSVSATLQKLEADLEADGKIRTESIYNGSEDIICPFVVSECCTGPDAETLAGLCGYTWDCPVFVNINFVESPELAALGYTVRVDGESYVAGDSIVREVGEIESFELVGVDTCGYPISYGGWMVKAPPATVFTNEGSVLSPLVYEVPASGMDIYPQVYCIPVLP